MEKEIEFALKEIQNVLDVWVPMKIKYDLTPGVVVCIAYKGKSLYLKAFGSRDIEGNSKLSADALFRVASMSKIFTTVAIMQLQERGELRLDDRVSDYLPWFKGKNKTSDLKNVTIRQMLSHTSGIFRDGEGPHWETDKFPKSLKKTISDKAIIIENLSGFKYSNHAFAILGEIIKKVSKFSYEEYVTKNIINPLVLKNTFPDLSDDIPTKLIAGYERFIPDKKDRIAFPHVKTYAYAPATGFISNARDMALFLSSLSLDTKKSVVNRESKKAMMQSHGKPACDDEYGLGLDIFEIKGRTIVGHSGGFAGFITNAITSVVDNIQVVVLTNTHSSTARSVSRGVMEMLYKVADNSHHYQKGKKLPHTYDGVYRNRWGDTVIVKIGNKLVGFSPQVNNPISCWSILEQKKVHEFENTDKVGFGSPKEMVRFSEIKNKKSQKMLWGSTPSKRVQ